jgi:hypothetical protein
MQIPPIPLAGQEQSIVLSPRNAIALQTGEIVQATVLIVTETAVAVRMKNIILEAKTTLPLKQGETLSLLVEEAGKETRLRVLRENGDGARSVKDTILRAIAALKGLKPAAEDIKVLTALTANASRALRELLPELKVLQNLASSLEGLSGSVLKGAVRDSGIFLEAKLRLLAAGAEQEGGASRDKLQALVNNDLKAALLSLKESLGNRITAGRLLQSGVDVNRLMSAAENLLKNTELLQLQSRLSDSLQAFVPFAWKELKDGELVFRESDRDRHGEQAYSCTVNLDLARTGWVSARLLLQSGLIFVDVIAEDELFCRVLQDHADLLRQQFESAGVRLEGLTIRREPRGETRPQQAGGLNIKV